MICKTGHISSVQCFRINGETLSRPLALLESSEESKCCIPDTVNIKSVHRYPLRGVPPC